MEIEDTKECQNALTSFPLVPLELWPNKRGDGKEGHHFNITQVPSDVEVDENGFSLDYQIGIIFELGIEKWSREVVMNMVVARLLKMDIELGEILGESIAIMCFHKTDTWSGVIKIHLKNPKVDAVALLQGSRPFILTLDGGLDRRGKVFKSYDT